MNCFLLLRSGVVATEAIDLTVIGGANQRVIKIIAVDDRHDFLQQIDQQKIKKRDLRAVSG
jgi:hypothetical protein